MQVFRMKLLDNKEQEFKIIIDHFAQFIRVHVRRFQLYKYGLDPEDIAQDVKMKIWKLVCSEKKIINYTSYIKKIVSSSVIDHLRKFRRDEGLYSHEKQIQIAEMELAYSKQAIRHQSLEELIGEAVELLINTRRQVVKLYLLNLSIQEIADYLKWSQDKTRNLLYRGLKDLKKILLSMDIRDEFGSR